MKKFISIISANLLVGSLFAAPVIDIHKVTSNDTATNEISDKETSLYSNIQLSVSGVTIKSNISDSNNYGLVSWDTFLKNSNIFFDDGTNTKLNNTTISISSSNLDSDEYIISSSFDFNITLDGNSSLFDNKISYGIYIKDAATGDQAETSLYLIDNTKPQIVNANIADDVLYITFDEDLSDGSGTTISNGTILSDLNESDFNISSTGVTLSNASFASNNKKKLKFDLTGTDITSGDVNITGAISSNVKDITGNPLDTDTIVQIKTAPMVLSAKTVDTTDFTLEYSKTMTVGDTNTSCADEASNYTILDSSNNSLSGSASIASIATADDTIFTLTLSGATILNSGELNVSGTLYSGWQINVNSNVADSSNSYTINDSGEVTFEVEDYISAIPSNPIWYDEDFDGKLDKLEISFDETMNTNISSLSSGVLSVRHDGASISENNFNLDSLTWSYDELKVYISLKSGYELDDTSMAADDSVTLTGTGSNLTDANGNIEIASLASTLPTDSASPVVTSLEFYDNYGMESFSTTDTSAEFNTSGTKDSISSDILKIYFSETLNTLDDTLISISTDSGYNYTALVDGTVGLSSDKSYAIVDLGSDTITLNTLKIKTVSAFATDSDGNSIASDIVYPTSLSISDESSFYIDSNDTLSTASTKVIIPFSEDISTSAITSSSTSFATQFSTTCSNASCSGIDTEIIDDTTIAIEFDSNVDDGATFTYIPSSYVLQNSDTSKDLKKSNTLLTKTAEADSLDTNGSIDFVTLKGILYQSDDTEAVVGTILTAFLATDAYQIEVSSSDTINSETIGAGSYIITPQHTTLGYEITVGNVNDINVSINYNDSNVTLTKGTSSISFSKSESTLIDEVRVIEPFVVGSTVISSTDGSYLLKVRNPHGRTSDIIILGKYGEDGDYYPVTSTINEDSITVSGNTVDRYLEYSSIYGSLNESIIVNLSMKNINKIELTQVDGNTNFNTFYLPVKKSYYENGSSDQLTPSANRLNANSDLTAIELDSNYDLNDLLFSIKTENSKTVPYLVESNFNLTTKALKDGLTNCIKYDGVANSSATGISGFKAITAGYGIGCYIPEALDLYFFGEAITSSDTIDSVGSISTWAMVGNWKYTGSLSGDSQNVSPSLDDNITQVIQYDSSINSSIYNLKVTDDFRETITFSTTQDGDDALFIQFNDDTTVIW